MPSVILLIDVGHPAVISRALVPILQAFFVIDGPSFQVVVMVAVAAVVLVADCVNAAVQLWKWAVGLVALSTIVE